MDARSRRVTGLPPWLLAVVGIVAGALIVYGVSWGWTQRINAHSQQVLAAQRGGDQSAELRFCLGVSQVSSGVRRAEVALAASNKGDFTIAIDAVKDGYDTARAAAHYVPSASVDTLSAPRNAVVAAVDATDDGLPQAPSIRPQLHALSVAAAGSTFDARCRGVLSEQRVRT
jgi:hypothetical protein